MFESGTHDSEKELLTAELLEAAFACGRSLQKSLALPGMATMCAELADSLLSRVWKPGECTRFAVREPKLREIFAPAFADRVVESWLVALVEEPLSRLFIDDTFANRKGKGTLAAVLKAQKFMRRPNHAFCLQLDMRNFFHSIHRPTLERSWMGFLHGLSLKPQRLALAAHISTALLRRVPGESFHTVRSSRPLLQTLPPRKSLLHAPADTGLPIGSAASQHFANFHLNGLDHFVKHELRVKGYIRYMDDLLLLGPDSATLLQWRDAIALYLRGNLRLSLHPDKELLSKTGQGIAYLGYRVYPHYLHVCSSSVNALKARLDFFKHLFRPERFPICRKPVRGAWHGLGESGEIRPPVNPDWPLLKRMEATINSYYGIMGHAQSYKLRKALYHKHFGPLRAFFVPADAGYSAVHVKRLFLYR
jgi:hypothetical protein